MPNVKPKAGVLVAAVDAEETVVEPDGAPVGDDVGSEAALDGEVEGKAEPVGIGMVPMVLAGSVLPEEVVPVPDGVPEGDDVAMDSEVEGNSEPVGIGIVPMVLAGSVPPGVGVVDPDAGAQSVADTVRVDTTVTVTMLSVPMTTVGVTIPFVAEDDVVAELPALDVILETELERTDVGLRVGSDDVAVVEVDEDDKI